MESFLWDLTVNQLKVFLGHLNQSRSGNKSELVARTLEVVTERGMQIKEIERLISGGEISSQEGGAVEKVAGNMVTGAIGIETESVATASSTLKHAVVESNSAELSIVGGIPEAGRGLETDSGVPTIVDKTLWTEQAAGNDAFGGITSDTVNRLVFDTTTGAKSKDVARHHMCSVSQNKRMSRDYVPGPSNSEIQEDLMRRLVLNRERGRSAASVASSTTSTRSQTSVHRAERVRRQREIQRQMSEDMEAQQRAVRERERRLEERQRKREMEEAEREMREKQREAERKMEELRKRHEEEDERRELERQRKEAHAKMKMIELEAAAKLAEEECRLDIALEEGRIEEMLTFDPRARSDPVGEKVSGSFQNDHKPALCLQGDAYQCSDGPRFRFRETIEDRKPQVRNAAGYKTREIASGVECQEGVGSRFGYCLEKLVRTNVMSRLPPIKVTPFAGDAGTYSEFVDAFDSQYDQSVLTPKDRYAYLLQCTIGPPHEVVRSCRNLGQEVKYQEARKMLEEKYGVPELIIDSYIRKLRSFPEISGSAPRELDRFHILLIEAKNALVGVERGLENLENCSNLRSLVCKLPPGLRDQWRKLKNKRREGGQATGFVEFVNFVRREAIAKNDPLYGEDVLWASISKSQIMPKAKALAANTRVGTNSGQESSQMEGSYEVERDHLDRVDIAGDVRQEGSAVGVTAGRDIESAPSGRANSFCRDCGGNHSLLRCLEFVSRSPADKWKLLQQSRLCFSCLEPGHFVRDCHHQVRCSHCSGPHPNVMHTVWMGRRRRSIGTTGWEAEGSDQRQRGALDDERPSNRVMQPRGDESVTAFCTSVRVRGGAMSLVPVQVRVGDAGTNTGAFLDSGSSVSFISRDTAVKLGLSLDEIPKENLEVHTLEGERQHTCGVVIGAILKGAGEVVEVSLPPLYVLDEVPVSRRDGFSLARVEACAHLVDLPLREVNDVGLMLGANALEAVEPLEIRSAPSPGDPYAVRTRLGWMVCGLDSSRTVNCTKVFRTSVRKQDKILETMVQRAFDCDLAAGSEEQQGLSLEDRRFLEKVEQGFKLNQNRFEVPLPLRDSIVRIPSSYGAARRRVEGLRKKLLKDREAMVGYVKYMRELQEEGHCERVTGNGRSLGKMWHVPHFEVRNPNQPGKMRVVFDCAAKVEGVALNDLLLQGPDLNNQLLDVLLRFRQGEMAVTADIKAMFYQVVVPPDQRDYLRFLWWDNDGLEGSPVEFRMTRHVFGAVSSPSIATWALKKTASELGKKSERCQRMIRDNFYVDDCLLASGGNAYDLAQDVKQLSRICAAKGFVLHKFATSCRSVAEILQVAMEPDERKALGVAWNLKEDCLGVVDGRSCEKPHTRRQLLAVLAGVYDPLGIVAPLILVGRLILQDAIRGGAMSWDKPLEESVLRQVADWTEALVSKSGWTVPRSVVSAAWCRELHVFSDASQHAYATVLYVREVGDFGIRVRFLIGKSRVGPLRGATIPRMELLAAVLGVRMRVRVETAMPGTFSRAVMWTDSTAVLGYVRNESCRYKVFVANRVAYVRSHSEVADWRHVCGTDNPADGGSRGKQTRRWLSGPDFLLEEEGNWPITNEIVSQEDLPEIIVNQVAARIEHNSLDRIFEFYSNWNRLRRATVWLRKFVLWLQGMQVGHSLEIEDVMTAEILIIAYLQRKHYPIEWQKCVNGMVVGSGPLRTLAPYWDGQVLRVGGRLENADLEEDTKHPVVVAGESPVSWAIIRWCHERVGHLGVSAVLFELRKRYWIPRAHNLVKRIIGRCVVCRKCTGKAMEQRMAPLPRDRVTGTSKAFLVTGVDCFGPFLVTFGRGHVKRWVMLFTCLAVRAVHLEIVEDMTADSAWAAIRRFLARRGNVKKFLSDRGTNFVGVNSAMVNVLKSEALRRKLIDWDIKWQFAPPGGSHFGGAWERMIGVTRRIMEKMLGNVKLRGDVLATVLAEAEMVINSRPLTADDGDPLSERPLSPADFLYLGNYRGGWASGTITVNLRSRWAQVEALAQQFWLRWKKEYLLTLQKRQKWFSSRRVVEKGDVVLVMDTVLPRGHWPLGKITETLVGADSLIRRVKVLVEGKEYIRPITKLVLILEAEELGT